MYAIRSYYVMPRLALFFAHVKELRATGEPYRDWGFLSEQEVNLWALTMRIAEPVGPRDQDLHDRPSSQSFVCLAST